MFLVTEDILYPAFFFLHQRRLILTLENDAYPCNTPFLQDIVEQLI